MTGLSWAILLIHMMSYGTEVIGAFDRAGKSNWRMHMSGVLVEMIGKPALAGLYSLLLHGEIMGINFLGLILCL